MGCVIKKQEISVIAIPKKQKHNLCESYETKTSKSPRKSINFNSSTFVRENEGNPHDFYDVLDLLGQGSFGIVYKVKHKASGQLYAMKILVKNTDFSSDTNEAHFFKEINILKSLDHQSILKIYEYFNTKNAIFIISELCIHGELFNKLITQGYLKEELVWKIMRQVLSAVSYFHSYNIIHRDLKPQNILICDESDEDIIVKVIDFGSSAIFTKPIAPGCIGTVYYIAPEVVSLEKYDSKCDLWSCGIMMYFLLSSEFPFSGESEDEVFTKALKGRFSFSNPIWNTISDQAKNLISGLLTKAPTRRLSARQALEHPWIYNNMKAVSTKSLTDISNHFTNFKVNGLLENAALIYIVRNCDKSQEFLDISRKFFLLDVNKDGKLSFDELVNSFCKIMNLEKAINSVKELFRLIDMDENDHIEYEDFLKVCLKKTNLLTENNLQNAYDFFDYNKDGKICINDLKAVLGSQFNYDDLFWENLISQYGKDCNGTLTFNNFKEIMDLIKMI
jgi:calcium-dependent protein kinase